MKKNILLSFSNGIGNFILVSPAIIALQEMDYEVDILLSTEDSDARKQELEDIIKNWDGLGLYNKDKKYDECYYVWGEPRTLPDLNWKMTRETQLAMNYFLKGHHEVAVNFSIAKSLGYTKPIPKLYIPTTKSNILIHNTVKNIAIHIGSRPEKEWLHKRLPIDTWIETLELLNDQYDKNVIFHLVSGFWEREDCKKLVDEAFLKGIIVNEHNGHTITQIAGMIVKCDCMITVDSGPMHVGGAVGIPIVQLFGPTLATKNDVWKTKSVLIKNTDLSCCPCLYTQNFTRCTKNICMQNITPQQIVSGVNQLLNGREKPYIHFVMPYSKDNIGNNEARMVSYLEKSKIVKYNVSNLRKVANTYFNNPYNATIVFKGEMLTPDQVQNLDGVKVLYFPDDILVYPAYAEMIERLGPYYDIVYTFDKHAISKFNELGCNNVKWMPIWTGDDLFYDQQLKRDIDICFIGSMNKERKKMLDHVRRSFSDKNIVFSDNIRGKEYAEHLNRSKIVLNLAQGATGTSQRVLEASACGALVLTNNIPEDERLYLSHEVCYWDTLEQLVCKITQYLANPHIRERLAGNGYKKTMSQHLFKSRFDTMLKDIKEFRT